MTAPEQPPEQSNAKPEPRRRFAVLFLFSLLSVPTYFVWVWCGVDLPSWLLWSDLSAVGILGLLAAVEWAVGPGDKPVGPPKS